MSGAIDNCTGALYYAALAIMSCNAVIIDGGSASTGSLMLLRRDINCGEPCAEFDGCN